MLYQRWCEIVEKNRTQFALHDDAHGKSWSFGELKALAEEKELEGGVVFPSERSLEFVLTILRAWRADVIVCPIERGQSPPEIPPIARVAGAGGRCVHIKCTSATSSGKPQLIAFTGEQLLADARNIVSTMKLSPDSPNLGVISLAHSYGFSNLVLPLLLFGIPLVLVSSPLPEPLKLAAGKFRKLTLAGVPALWRAWHEANVIPPNLELAISAGAPLSIVLETKIFENSGLKIHNFYGASECGGIAFDRSSTPRLDAALVGDPMDNVLLSLSSEGCLEVKSEAVGSGYLTPGPNSPGQGIFKTNDLAAFIKGAVYLLGRVGDQIHIAGRKLSPETIEEILLKHPKVKDCLVFGAPAKDHERFETIIACVQPRGFVTSEELRNFLLLALPDWQLPRDWWFVEDLETNERGKRSRSQWREKYLKR